MSLINDALKRASQTEPPPPPAIDMMQPVHYSGVSKWPLIVLPALFVAVVAMGVWFLIKGVEVARQFNTPEPVAARKVDPYSEPFPATVAPAAEAAPAVEVAAAPVEAAPVPMETTAPTNAAPVVVTPSFPALKLQAVFYRPTKPSVVINARMLFVGDTIETARLVSISRDSVVVEWRGERREFLLP